LRLSLLFSSFFLSGVPFSSFEDFLSLDFDFDFEESFRSFDLLPRSDLSFTDRERLAFFRFTDCERLAFFRLGLSDFE